MSLLAVNYLFADILVVLLTMLGLLSICIPRPRKKFEAVDKRKKLVRRKPSGNATKR
ncbi:MAG: hypothetical protein GY819_16740 [Planctomycetaceae bacterium]|nr:hypothetical protein [Planctomycetaceae bacterium]MCP4464443.1 hypothetical protein [Planctomycetaceae bacterium]MDG1808832.1 hypothetical protein [Pirellulaceae bacterium]MDG2102888.1 hypothetical protein [Pirellulaceae bacterium]